MKNLLQHFLVLIISATALSISAFAQESENVEFTAYFKMQPGTNQGRLIVEAEIAEGWNLYSTTTPVGGPMKTKFIVLDSREFQVSGPFEPDEDPKQKFEEVFSIIVEEFVGQATWSAPIELAKGISPDKLEINLKIKGQSCTADSGVCLLVNENLTAAFEGDLESKLYEENYQPERAHVVWSGTAPEQVTAGETIQIRLTAAPTDGYKIYAYELESQNTIAQPTRIVLSKSHGWTVTSIEPEHKPLLKNSAGELQKYHKDEITWTVNLLVPENAKARTYQFQGLVAFQNCTDEVCDQPTSAMFSFDLTIGESTNRQTQVGFTKSGSYQSVAELADRKAKEALLRSEHK